MFESDPFTLLSIELLQLIIDLTCCSNSTCFSMLRTTSKALYGVMLIDFSECEQHHIDMEKKLSDAQKWWSDYNFYDWSQHFHFPRFSHTNATDSVLNALDQVLKILKKYDSIQLKTAKSDVWFPVLFPVLGARIWGELARCLQIVTMLDDYSMLDEYHHILTALGNDISFEECIKESIKLAPKCPHTWVNAALTLYHENEHRGADYPELCIILPDATKCTELSCLKQVIQNSKDLYGESIIMWWVWERISLHGGVILDTSQDEEVLCMFSPADCLDMSKKCIEREKKEQEEEEEEWDLFS